MSSTFYSNHLFSTLPAQKIPFSEKNKEWRENCVQAICSMGSSRTSNGRSRWARKQANYDLVNSIIDEDDFSYVLNPYGIKENVGKQPAKLRDINLVVNKINTLKGDELQRPFNFTVIAVNGEAVNEKQKKKHELILQVATQKLAKELGLDVNPQIDPETGEEIPVSFEHIDKYLNTTHRNMREITANHLLKYLKYADKLELKFNEGWEHALIVAEEIYYIGITNGKPSVRVCNPLNCEFDRNPDNPNIQDGDWFKEDRWMTKGQILDEFGEYLNPEQLERLDRGNIAQGLTNQMFPGFGYTETDMSGFERGNFPNRSKSSTTHYLVTHTVWKSMKEIGFLKFPDENGNMQETVVESGFKFTAEMKKAGASIEWRWISDIWHGTRIANDIFVQVEPVPNQIRYSESYEVKLPYVGRIYGSTNSMQTSFVDLIKPHQYLYNIIWFRLEAEIAKAKGKKMVMDFAQIPRSEGINLEQWMYFFDNVGIAFINSFEEGKDRFQGQTSQFNQFQTIDTTISQSIGQYINILSKIEQLVDRITGITPQREGVIGGSETVGGAERAISGSSLITEPYFYIHSEVKKEVLTHLLEAAKFAMPDSKVIEYILDDAERASFTFDSDKFCDSEYGIFVSNSSKENSMFQKIEALANQALSSGAATYADIVKMYKASSVAELSNMLDNSQAKLQQQKQQEQQHEAQMQQQQQQAVAEMKQAEMSFEANENQLNRENQLRIATLNSISSGDGATDNVDAMKYSELQFKSMSEDNKIQLDRINKQQESVDKDKDRQVKREEIKSKEKIAKLQANVALKNRVVGEK